MNVTKQSQPAKKLVAQAKLGKAVKKGNDWYNVNTHTNSLGFGKVEYA